MRATEILKGEHKVVQLVLRAAEREVRSMEATGKVDAEKVGKMLDFSRNFTDRCHHAKEEKHLFVKLQESGMRGDCGPIAVMLQEHIEGRRRVKAIAEALPQAREGNSSAIVTIKQNLSAYVELLREHIRKEDEGLFSTADHLLTPEDQQALTEAFDKVEAAEMGEGVHEKYHRLAHELAD